VTAQLEIPAKFHTARDLNYPTRGHQDDAFARIWMGKRLLPWHRRALDVAGEYDPATGLPRYPMIVLPEPRQAGKSFMAMAKNGRKCFTNPGHRAWYTAQTGQDARDQFLKFHDDTLAGSALQGAVTLKRGNGHECMTFANGSTLRPHPPTEDAMHGKQSDDNDIDEAWAFSAEHGALLLQAIGPTQLTRPGAQTWIYSAGGTAESTWLAELVARGRATDGAPGMGICYVEYGIPEGSDAEDLQNIYDHHPAAGTLITMESLKALRELFGDDAAGWARAAGNVWTEVIGGGIPAATWAAAQTTDELEDGAPIGWGAARAGNGSHVAIAAAVQLEGGRVVAELVDLVPAHGAAERVRSWVAGDTLMVSRSGSSSGLADDLELLKVPLELWDGKRASTPTTRDEASACQTFLDSLTAGAFTVRPHPDLDTAVAVAGKRRTTGGGFVWAPTAGGFPIAALEALTWATYAVRHRRPRIGKPVDRWAS
jgi:hypothetical protein